MLLDLSAAFDTLDHTLLLQRLHAEIGLDGSAFDWFSSYLSCRSQQVLVGHALSAETPLLCGVPQGSVLGPLLFSLYTRQLADLIDKFCIDYHFFADRDSELYSCLPTEPESALSALRNVESCCRQIKIWMTKNKLKLNEQKTEVLLCGPSSRRETVPVDCLSVGEASIPFSNVVKTLGVTLDAELSMERHVSSVVRSCFFHIRSLSKVRPYITYKAASSIAVCLILSKLDYCNSLLSGLPPKQIKRLQAVQNAAARTVMKCKKKQITSLPFLGSFIGFLSRNGSATKFSLPLTGQFMITPPSTSRIFSKNTTLLAFSDQHLDLSLMFPGPGIPRQSGTASKPSDMSLPPSGMSSPRASRRRTPFSLSDLR